MFNKKKEIFSLRKLSVGLVSACIGTLLGTSKVVFADAQNNNQDTDLNDPIVLQNPSAASAQDALNSYVVNTANPNQASADANLDGEHSSYTIKTEQRPFDEDAHQIQNPVLSSQLNLAINRDLAVKIVLPIELEHSDKLSDITQDVSSLNENYLKAQDVAHRIKIQEQVLHGTGKTSAVSLKDVPTNVNSIQKVSEPVQQRLTQESPKEKNAQPDLNTRFNQAKVALDEYTKRGTQSEVTNVDLTLTRSQALNLAQDLLANTGVDDTNREAKAQHAHKTQKKDVKRVKKQKTDGHTALVKPVDNALKLQSPMRDPERIIDKAKTARINEGMLNNKLKANVKQKPVVLANSMLMASLRNAQTNKEVMPKSIDSSKVRLDLDWHVINFKNHYHVNNNMGFDGFNLPKVGHYRLQLIKYDTNAFQVSFAYLSDEVIQPKTHVFNISQTNNGYTLKVSEADVAHRVLKQVKSYKITNFKQLNRVINFYANK